MLVLKYISSRISIIENNLTKFRRHACNSAHLCIISCCSYSPKGDKVSLLPIRVVVTITVEPQDSTNRCISYGKYIRGGICYKINVIISLN